MQDSLFLNGVAVEPNESNTKSRERCHHLLAH